MFKALEMHLFKYLNSEMIKASKYLHFSPKRIIYFFCKFISVRKKIATNLFAIVIFLETIIFEKDSNCVLLLLSRELDFGFNIVSVLVYL